jgi:hypothetical protein
MKTNLYFLFKVSLTSALLIFITGTFITGQDVIAKKNGDETKAIIYFYRPSKVMGSPNEIIVGTNVPDEVIVKLKNGHWFKTEYAHTGQREFITGIFSINSETLKIDIEPGKIYYIKCSIMKGMGMQSQIEIADEQIAKKEMNGLKEQKTAK